MYNGELVPAAQVAERGFKLMIHTATLGVAFRAMRDAMAELARNGALAAGQDPRLFAEMVELLGVPEQLERAAKYER